MQFKAIAVTVVLLGCFARLAQGQNSVSSNESLRIEYREFQQNVEKIISSGREVAANDRERADLRTIQWLLQEFTKHVDAGDWKRAAESKRKMEVALQRSGKVAIDAPRRKAERARAEKERQHQEQLRQRDRQHQEIMNELRKSRRY